MLAFISAACASPGIPPGGPIDKTAPKLVKATPDSGKTGVTLKELVLQFDEVVAERPQGVTSLDQLILISPRDGTPIADWHRKEIAIKPSKGWRPNTTYVVTVLPGLADLHGNIRNTSLQTFFSTGPTISSTVIDGEVWDWAAGILARNAFVEAMQLPDTTGYITVTDSVGHYRIPYAPPGKYLVRGIVDQNRNRGLDPREPWDTVTVTLSDSARATILAYVHDTIPPSLERVSLDDSATLRATFDRPLAPTLPATSAFKLAAADSVAVPILEVSFPAPDSIAAKNGIPKPSPSRILLLTIGHPLKPSTDYKLTATGIHGQMGAVGNPVRVFTTPPPPPATKK